MVRITFLVALLDAASVFAAPSPVVPDPAGVKNIGNGVGTQFIGGTCLSSKDCASTCCAFNNNGGGVCSGLGAQFQAGKSGCGFGDGGASPSSAAAASISTTTSAASSANTATSGASGNVAAASIDTSAPGSQNVGTGNGQQFITGQCFSDADCASACCAGPKGVCSAVAVAFDSGKQGCGFTVSGAASSAAPAAAAVAVDTPATAAGTTTAVVIDTSAPGAQNVGKGNAQQFITGQCLSDADCASACCANPKGVCSAVAVAFDAGKQGCGFVGTVA